MRVVDPASPQDILRDLNDHAAGKSVDIEMVSGETLHGTGLVAAVDSTSWVSRDEWGAPRSVATPQVAKVVVHERVRRRCPGRGAMVGAAVGTLPWLFGRVDEDDSVEGYVITTVLAVLATTAAVGIGALVGFLIQVEKDETTTYILNEGIQGP